MRLPIAALLIFTFGCMPQKTTTGLRPEISGPYRASRAIEAALSVGVSYVDFAGLVQALAREVMLAADSVRFDPTIDRRLIPVIERYQRLSAMYHDSEQIWGFEIRKEQYDASIPVIAQKYGLTSAITEIKHGPPYAYTEKVIAYARIRQGIWEQATKVHEENLSVVFGGPLPEPSPIKAK